MLATKKRVQYHHGDLERAVRDATVALLAEVGAERVSLREVARRVGVNHRAVYRHFEDKRALFASIATDGYDALAQKLRDHIAASGRDDGEGRLVALGEAYVRFARSEPARYELMFGPRLNEDARFPELERAMTRAVAVLDEELERAAPQATARERRDAGIALWAAVHGLSALVLVRRVKLKDALLSRYVDVLLRPMVRGLVASLPR